MQGCGGVSDIFEAAIDADRHRDCVPSFQNNFAFFIAIAPVDRPLAVQRHEDFFRLVPVQCGTAARFTFGETVSKTVCGANLRCQLGVALVLGDAEAEQVDHFAFVAGNALVHKAQVAALELFEARGPYFHVGDADALAWRGINSGHVVCSIVCILMTQVLCPHHNEEACNCLAAGRRVASSL